MDKKFLPVETRRLLSLTRWQNLCWELMRMMRKMSVNSSIWSTDFVPHLSVQCWSLHIRARMLAAALEDRRPDPPDLTVFSLLNKEREELYKSPVKVSGTLKIGDHSTVDWKNMAKVLRSL